MFDQKVTLSVVGAALGWAIGLGITVAQVFTDYHIGFLGLAVAISGATLTVRHCINKAVSHNRESFEIGRQAGMGATMTRVR